ncbi:MAG TPA: sulfotransferase [Rhizomicrobium sp.]|nr:sulfotransferase [Rhizomicrobium sp.]
MSRPFFIVSSGRSGTAMLTKALSQSPDVTVEHEYMVHIAQPLGVRRYQGLASAQEAATTLAATHGAAIHYCPTRLWGDSSNKLSWLIPDLIALFPQALFIHLVRDGRKVASSYFHKLGAENYDDHSTAVLADYLRAPDKNVMPPPEKKYWWPQPLLGAPWADAFPDFDQFERIAWHWAEINAVILRDMENIAPTQRLFVRLEDLRASPSAVQALYAFLGLPWQDSVFSAFQRPHNVNRPVDTPLTPDQAARFSRIAGAMMKRLDYAGREEYAVAY